jgi:Secretion system C-terminal sorting domain
MSDVAVEDNYYGNDELLPLVKILSHNVNIWQAGVYYINYQVTDPSGNKSQVVLRPVMVQYPPDCENSFLGKKDLTLSEQVMVYPNPTSGIVKVDFAVNNMNPMSIVVTNLVGATVAEYNYGGGFGSMTLDLGKYGQGAYMIHIANQNEVTTKKIIVTK